MDEDERHTCQTNGRDLKFRRAKRPMKPAAIAVGAERKVDRVSLNESIILV